MKIKLTPTEAGKLGFIAAAETIAHKKQQRIDTYNLNPKLCKFCQIIIPYNKKRNDYCSQSCSAKLLNILRGHVLSENKIFICFFCKKEFNAKGTNEHKYCSRECMKFFWWEETKKNLLIEGYDNSYNHLVAKRYLIELYEGSCQICKLTEWLKKPIALVLDHINGNSEDGSLSNLRVICNNCDAQTDTYKNKNKGNGRAKRRQRYQEGKSY